MPQQMSFGHSYRETVVEYAFEVLGLEVLFVAVIRTEKRRGRQLFRVADYDCILSPCYGSYRFARRHLRRFVENDEVEFLLIDIEILRNRHGTHKHTRTSRAQNFGDFRKQRAYRCALHIGLFGAVKHYPFEIMFSRLIRTRQCAYEFIIQFVSRKFFIFVGQLSETCHSFFERQTRKPAKHVVEIQLASDKVVIYAFFKTFKNVFGRDFAVKQRFQHEIESLFSASFHNALISAPARNIVHIFFNIGYLLDGAVDFFARVLSDDVEKLFKRVFRFVFGLVRAHVILHKNVRFPFRKPCAGFVEKIVVAIGVQRFCRGV